MATAIQAIYRDLEYAQTLVRARQARSKPTSADPDLDKVRGTSPPRDLDDNYETEADLEDEESWTFIGDDADPELRRRMEEFEISKLGNRGPRASLNLDKERGGPTKRMSVEVPTTTANTKDSKRKSVDLKHVINPKR